MGDLQSIITSKKEEVDKLNQKLSERMQQAIGSKDASLLNLENDIQNMEELIAKLEIKLVHKEKEIENLSNRLEEQMSQISSKDERNDNLSEMLNNQMQSNERMTKELQEKGIEMKRKEMMISDLETEIGKQS